MADSSMARAVQSEAALKSSLAAVIVVVSALLCVEAHAFELGTPAEEHPYRSRQNAALELRFGPYKPDIGAYEKAFDDHARVYAGVELDWELYRIPGIGTIGPGFQAGRASMSRKSRGVVGSYALTVYPFVIDAVLRVDQLWRRFGVPFMPYAKVGLGVGFWKASTALRNVLADGTKSSGRSFGEMGAIGAALPLDFFDTGTARGTDTALGINTSAVYFEYSFLELNGYGATLTLRVGDRTWTAGLMFEL